MDEREREETQAIADEYGVDPEQLHGVDGVGSPGRVRMLAAAAAESRRNTA